MKIADEYAGCELQYSDHKVEKNPFIAFIKIICGFIISFIAYFVVYSVLYFIISFIGQIPFLSSIIYYPSDASWALIVLPNISAIEAGIFCSAKISGTAKPFCAAIVLIFLCYLYLMIRYGAFSWSILFTIVVSIVPASIGFFAKKEDIA